MSIAATEIQESTVILGSQFSEPMRVIGTPTGGDGFLIVNLVGTRTNTFRSGVTLTKQDLAQLSIEQQEKPFTGHPILFKLGLEALRISLAQEYDPYFGLSISRVDPLPHQLDAVYNHLLKSARCRFLLADDAGAGKTIMAGLLIKASSGDLKDIVLGQLHPSEARSITSAILARLRHDSLLSREIGASYIERNWPPALKESGAWPLAGLKAAFFQGQFTRLEKADDALRTTIVRAVTQGTLGLASGKDANNFDRVWFKEPVDEADLTFDYDTYVLLPRIATGLKEAGASGVAKLDQGKPQVPTPDFDGTTVPPRQGSLQMDTAEKQVLSWEGELRRDQWNLFSLKVLTRLGQADEATIKVKVAAKPKDSSVKDQLNQGLSALRRDSAITGRIRIYRSAP